MLGVFVNTVVLRNDLSGDPRLWPDLDDGVPSQGEETSFIDTTANDERRFYVIEEQP